MRVAPASREFSSSSFRTEAGRSTTSPAAILLATCSESTWIRPMRKLHCSVFSAQNSENVFSGGALPQNHVLMFLNYPIHVRAFGFRFFQAGVLVFNNIKVPVQTAVLISDFHGLVLSVILKEIDGAGVGKLRLHYFFRCSDAIFRISVHPC